MLTILSISPFTESLISGIVSDLLFLLLSVYVIQRFRYWLNLKRKFHNKQFEVFLKSSRTKPVHHVTCTVSKNIITYKGTMMTEDDPFKGEFIMNEISLKLGEGFHTHSGSDGFGFSRIIIRGDEFYVESPYTVHSKGSTEGVRVYQAFIWKRKD